MEEVINKPDSQFEDILIDLTDYSKDLSEKDPIIKELCRPQHHSKPIASLNSSTYSSAASSSSSSASSSSSSTSDSSTNSSSLSSTLSSPGQNSNQNKTNNNSAGTNEFDKIEIAKMVDLGKTAKILEHRLASSEHQKDMGAINDCPMTITLHSERPNLKRSSTYGSSQQFITTNSAYNNARTNTSENLSTNSSWRTIGGKRDKRRRKPTEQPVLSQHIPGHRGEQEVDLLVNFIESGKKNNNSKNAHKNKPTKSETSNHNSRTTNNKNLVPSTVNNLSTNSLKKSEMNTNTNTNAISNTDVNTIATTNTHTNNIKPQVNISKSSSNQAKGTVQVTQPHPTASHQNLNSQSKKQMTDDTAREMHFQRKNGNKIAQPRHHSKTISNSQNSIDSSPNKVASSSQSPQMNAETGDRNNSKQNMRSDDHVEGDIAEKSVQNGQDAVVTFADHIKISDAGQYTFGFFDEPSDNCTDCDKSTKGDVISNSSNPQSQQLEQPKTSPNSDRKRYRYNDNVDTNSFNYEQILEFISKAWENTTKKNQRLTTGLKSR